MTTQTDQHQSLTQRLRERPPLVHAGHAYLGLAWPALEWLERTVQPGWSTLETGSGASTIVFASRGASHLAISPSADEHRRIVEFCREQGLPTEQLHFIADSSHTALERTWTPEPLDLVLVDGAHGFPFPVLDWYLTARHLKVGGLMVLDDAYQPAVGVVVKYLQSIPGWRLDATPGHRTVAFRKLDDSVISFDWDDTTLGRARFGYLPPGRRLVAWARYRGIERSPLARIVSRQAGAPEER